MLILLWHFHGECWYLKVFLFVFSLGLLVHDVLQSRMLVFKDAFMKNVVFTERMMVFDGIFKENVGA